MLDLINTSSTREIDKDIYINVNSWVDVCMIVTVHYYVNCVKWLLTLQN